MKKGDVMETVTFKTLAQMAEEFQPVLDERKQLHAEDGLYYAEDIKVYIDIFKKSITRHQGSEFMSGRIKPEQLADVASKKLGKVLETFKIDEYGIHPTVHLKEVRATS